MGRAQAACRGGRQHRKERKRGSTGRYCQSQSTHSAKTQRKVKDEANPRDAAPIKQPAETLEVSRRLENQGTYGVYN